MKILCTICVRGGSKTLKNKNIKKINNKPLIYYTIKQAQKSKLFHRIVVSTDSKKIQKIVEAYGIKNFFLRPKHLSTSKSPKIPVIRHAMKQSERFYIEKYDYTVDLDATSPLRLISDIKNSLKKIVSLKSDLLFSVNESRVNPYFNSVVVGKNKIIKPLKKLGYNLKRRQDAPKAYDINASIYIWKRKTLLNSDTLFVKKNAIYNMPNSRGLDIDTANDFKIVNFLMKNEIFRKI